LQEREYNLHDPGDRNLLVHDWLSYAESGDKDIFWAYDALAILIDDDPSLAWTIILELVHRALTESTFGLAATGPLEDLIAFHGAEVIALIEQQSDSDEVLREALRRVHLDRSDLDTITLNRYVDLGVRRIG
jgi:hypothetical protein